MLILVKLSVHLNQMYPSVLKYYEKNQFVDIFYTRKALKTGPYSIASVHSFFKKPQALQKKSRTVYRNMFAQMSYFECLLTFILGEMLSN